MYDPGKYLNEAKSQKHQKPGNPKEFIYYNKFSYVAVSVSRWDEATSRYPSEQERPVLKASEL